MTDWAARAEAAQALRRLNRAVAGFDVDAGELRAIARDADERAGRLEQGRRRQKADDMEELGAVDDRGGWQRAVAVGETMEFDPFSPGGGRLHPASIGFELRRDAETSVEARVTVDPMFQGPPDRVHGGIVALIVDEVMGCVNSALEQRAFTAQLIVNFRAPAPIDVPLTFRAWRHEVRARKITIRAEGHSPDGLFVDAEGLFIAVTIDEPVPGG
jgi:acyl-coenzyme A thioesterase PaaI-like protein